MDKNVNTLGFSLFCKYGIGISNLGKNVIYGSTAALKEYKQSVYAGLILLLMFQTSCMCDSGQTSSISTGNINSIS